MPQPTFKPTKRIRAAKLPGDPPPSPGSGVFSPRVNEVEARGKLWEALARLADKCSELVDVALEQERKG